MPVELRWSEGGIAGGFRVVEDLPLCFEVPEGLVHGVPGLGWFSAVLVKDGEPEGGGGDLVPFQGRFQDVLAGRALSGGPLGLGG